MKKHYRIALIIVAVVAASAVGILYGNNGKGAMISTSSLSNISVGSMEKKAYFLSYLKASDNKGQCNNSKSTVMKAKLNKWTKSVRLDTDNRDGGCYQSFSIYDPKSELKGLNLVVDYVSDGDTEGQCGNIGEQTVPLNSNLKNAKWTSPIFIDTDDRYGACKIGFSIEGRSDVELDINYSADGDAGQCGNTGSHTIKEGGDPVYLRYDMDGRDGGCNIKFKLREL